MRMRGGLSKVVLVVVVAVQGAGCLAQRAAPGPVDADESDVLRHVVSYQSCSQLKWDWEGKNREHTPQIMNTRFIVARVRSVLKIIYWCRFYVNAMSVACRVGGIPLSSKRLDRRQRHERRRYDAMIASHVVTRAFDAAVIA